MSSIRPVSALVVGAISADLAQATPRMPGGVVHHAGLALARLGARTRVITSVCEADAAELLAPLRAEGVEICARPSALTTVYFNDYSGKQDAHELRAVSDPIGPDAVPSGWGDCDLVQLGPLHRNDLLPDTVHCFRGLVGIDLQGLVREPRADGTVLSRFDRLGEFLRDVPVVKVSELELPLVLDGASIDVFMRRHGVRELLVTRGASGSLLTTASGTESIPAVRARRRAPIGAGDVFLAAYLYARVCEFAPKDAARIASRVSAAKVARGDVPKGFPLTGSGR